MPAFFRYLEHKKTRSAPTSDWEGSEDSDYQARTKKRVRGELIWHIFFSVIFILFHVLLFVGQDVEPLATVAIAVIAIPFLGWMMRTIKNRHRFPDKGAEDPEEALKAIRERRKENEEDDYYATIIEKRKKEKRRALYRNTFCTLMVIGIVVTIWFPEVLFNRQDGAGTVLTAEEKSAMASRVAVRIKAKLELPQKSGEWLIYDVRSDGADVVFDMRHQSLTNEMGGSIDVDTFLSRVCDKPNVQQMLEAGLHQILRLHDVTGVFIHEVLVSKESCL